MKKVLFLILIITFPFVMKAEEVEINGIKYELIKKAKSAKVIRGGNYYGDVSIPSTFEYEGIEYSVTRIEDYAFSDCMSMTSIEIPSTLISVGYMAFFYCRNLSKVIISDIAAWCNIDYYSITENPLSYAKYLYLNDQLIENLIIPDGVTSIKKGAFHSCKNIKSLTIPSSVKTIEDDAYSDCEELSSISFANGLQKIGASAFFNCSSLSSIDIPYGVTSIGKSAFSYCRKLASVNLPLSLYSMGENAFSYCNSLEYINIPDIENFAMEEFYDCTSLKTVTIPNSVSTIGIRSFGNCSSLLSVTIGKGVKTIKSGSFSNCGELEKVYCLSSNVPYAQDNAFADSYIEYAKLIVPDESVDAYKEANVWKNFGTIEGLTGNIPDKDKCATPTIHYANGKLTFECETEGVFYNTTITIPDATFYGNMSEVNLTGTYHIEVYAYKVGLENSDTATLDINLLEGSGPAIKGDVNGDGLVNISDVTDIINIILGK